jgi:hypothetical protein
MIANCQGSERHAKTGVTLGTVLMHRTGEI